MRIIIAINVKIHYEWIIHENCFIKEETYLKQNLNTLISSALLVDWSFWWSENLKSLK